MGLLEPPRRPHRAGGEQAVDRYRKIVLIVAAPAVLLGLWALRSAASPWEVAVRADVLRDRGVVYRSELEAYLVWTGDEPLALWSDAQHSAAEEVLYCESSGLFKGPHGETFDRTGRYYGGPAGSDLDRFPVQESGGFVYVDPSARIETPRRAERASEPVGPECPEPLTEGPPGFVSPEP